MAVMGLLLVAVGKWQGDLSGAGGVVGFMLLPVAMLAGAPWSLMTLKGGSGGLFLFAAITGPLINGAVFGAAYGYMIARRRQRVP
jgi:ABC-type xylose transport system permease subunit